MTPFRENDADIELVRSFANTVAVEEGTDRLGSIDGFRDWLREHGLGGVHHPIGTGDLALARDLRRALRAEMASHRDDAPDPAARATLDRVSAGLPVHLVPSTGALEPVAEGARGALTRVVASTHSLVTAGLWNRLKVCPDDDCGWAFYDTSRNRSRRWCSMNTCGNRHKVRAYRDRLAE